MAVVLTIALFCAPLVTCAVAPRAYRYVVAVGAVLAAVEWVLAYRDNLHADWADSRAGVIIGTGLFAVLGFLIWLIAAAGGVFLCRGMTRAAAGRRRSA